MDIKQEFKPAFKIFTGGRECEVQSRTWELFIHDAPEGGKLRGARHKYWTLAEDGNEPWNQGAIPEMGGCQIEEIWKHYKDTIWVSNYGYVADIPHEEEEEAFGKDRLEEFKQGFSFRTCNADGLSKIKDLIIACNFVPKNVKSFKCQINLHVEQVKEDLYKMIAKAFLKEPDDSHAGVRYAVHHLDNNSYNNSVTNLIYLKTCEHGANHALFHPMSHCPDYRTYQTFAEGERRKPPQKTKGS